MISIPPDHDIEKRVRVSESGKWLAHTFADKISLWEITNHRPLLCWVIVLSAVLLALWLSWPRKVKAA